MLRSRSIRGNFYMMLSGLLLFTILLGLTFFFNHRFIRLNNIYARMLEMESQFLHLAVEESHLLEDQFQYNKLIFREKEFSSRCITCHERKSDLPEQRIDLLISSQENKSELSHLLRDVQRRVAELSNLISTTHENHLLSLRQILRSDNRSGGTFVPSARNDAKSPGSEPEVMQEVGELQHILVDILSDFRALKGLNNFRQIRSVFSTNMQTYYSAVDNFADLSRNEEDQKLARLLLENGQIFEQNFERIVDLEKQEKAVNRALARNRQGMMDIFARAGLKIRQERERFWQRTLIITRTSLLVAGLLLFLLFFQARHLLRALKTMVDQTRKISRDPSYQIPLERHGLEELQVLRQAMNIMARQLNERMEKLREEITARVQVEQQIHRAKTEWERTFDAVPDMIAIISPDCRIRRANIPFAKMVGVPIKEVAGRYCYELIHGVSKTPQYCLRKNCCDKLRHRQYYEPHLDRHLDVSLVPFTCGEDEFSGAVLVIRDISASVRAQERHRQMEQRLRSAEKMEMIGMMAGGVAHDLNNILSGIINYPELLLLETTPESSQSKMLTAIRDSGRRAAAIVADLLTVARGAASVRELCLLNDLVEQYLASPEFALLCKTYPDVELKVDLALDLHWCRCSPVHIQKLLMNLLANGYEAISGPGLVRISTANTMVRTGSAESRNLAPGPYVKLVVEDTGTGISEEDLPHIFEPFYSKKKLGRSGTGLGLAIVWNTVQDHGGTVTVESGSDGSRFIVLLPAVDEEQPHSRDNSRAPEFLGLAEGTILVVDDNEMQRDIASRMLEMLGYSVESVGSGEEAVEFLRHQEVDLVLLDMIMDPGMNGRQTLEQILKIRPDQKALIVSGYSESEEVRKACALGACGFTKKPYTLEEIAQIVHRILGQKPSCPILS
ncbi:response regulator [Desulfolithobacter sp.]